MKKLLAISSSPNVTQSQSRQLVSSFADNFRSSVPNAEVVIRDIGENPPPHLDETTISAFFTPPGQHNDQQKNATALSNTLIDELEEADVIVIGAPMHNFGIPSALKAYFDQIARAGRTFQYSANGPQGLLNGKKVIVLTSRGGDYSQPPMSDMDHQVPYLRTVLGFVGLDNVDFIHCQGLAMGEDVSAAAIDNAMQSIASSIRHLAS